MWPTWWWNTLAILAESATVLHLELLSKTNTSSHTTTPMMPLTLFRRLARPSVLSAVSFAPARSIWPPIAASAFQNSTPAFAAHPTPSSRAQKCTLIQVLRQGRIAQKARKLRSPQLRDRPELKGVCLKVGTTKPKKPNSGERKIARVRLSTGKVITAYIPGEGIANTCQTVGYGKTDQHRSQCTAAFSCHGTRRASTRLPWCEVPFGQRSTGSGKSHNHRCHGKASLTICRVVSVAESPHGPSTERRSPRRHKWTLWWSIYT